jgi:hypothetical protein
VIRSGLLLGVALALITVTVAPAQELTPLQRQWLGGVKKILVETIQKHRANCEATTKRACDMVRTDVLDEVLQGWENTPEYGKYALGVMEWQGDLSITIGNMMYDYERRHGGRLDEGFEKEVLNRTATDSAFSPPAEYTCRHLFGTPHLSGSQGPCK